MVSQNRIIIVVFTVLFLILIGIQGFFMYKTYLVKEKEIYRYVLDRSTGFIDHLEERDRHQDDQMMKEVVDYAHKDIREKQFLNYFEFKKRNYQKELSNYIDQQFKDEGYRVAVELKYNSIIQLPDSTQLLKKPIVLYETLDKVKKPGTQTTGSWNSSSTSVDDETKKLKRNDHFKIFSETNYQVLNIKKIVFRELASLIILCILILGAVVWLFVLTVKNLIKQQKQVEILHTAVDNISHEFRTPIATLKVASKSLKKNWNKENLPLIDRQISRLEHLMLRLENPSDKELIPIEKEEWDDCIQDLQFLHPNVEIIIENEISGPLFLHKTDMETILKNLCENSVKYGATKIIVEVKNAGNRLFIRVCDNGLGIDKKEHKAVFEKFYRVQSNNIHNTKGLGLGLFLVKNLVQKYNGEILLESELNKGTVFKIELPYET
ncbi:MAG: hypothetical protein BGO40_07655 [Chryseobacterium sp. 39-10]|nr:HAMP domain-containing histidine kinase [Chryseobacterium sp.]OJV45901.1 MAG: hypothetical protein BGO40_07655 [Chryseobacterium sp. 39-10]